MSSRGFSCALEAALEVYLFHHDPLKKAERAQRRKAKKEGPAQKTKPAQSLTPRPQLAQNQLCKTESLRRRIPRKSEEERQNSAADLLA